MNNDLKQFSEERLKEIAMDAYEADFSCDEIEALARIALAAKQAKPVAWITWHQGCRAPDDCEDYLNAYTYKTEEKSVDGSDAFPVYTAPQPAHTEQDGWIKCSERMPDDWQLVAIINAGHGEIYEAATVTRSGPHFILMDGLEASNYDGGAVVTLSMEATHWMPLPAAPKPESEL